MSDNAATDGGRWRSARSDDAGIGECWRRLVDGCSFWWWETRRAYCVVKRSCCIVDGVVVVVVVEEHRFARVIKVGAGSDASGGRTAELLKVAASGSGVVTSSGAWTWSSATERRVLECCSFSSRRER